MLKRYSIAEARDRLAALVHKVERGSAVELTRRGKTVAVLMSIQQYQQLQAEKRSFWSNFETFRDQFDLRMLDIEPEIFTDQRDKTPGREVNL